MSRRKTGASRRVEHQGRVTTPVDLYHDGSGHSIFDVVMGGGFGKVEWELRYDDVVYAQCSECGHEWVSQDLIFDDLCPVCDRVA